MGKSRVILTIFILAVLVGVIFLAKGTDRTEEILSIDKSVVEALSSAGISENDLIAREEVAWREGRQRGINIAYEIEPQSGISVSDIEKNIRVGIEPYRHVSLNRVYFSKDEEGEGQTRFDILYRGRNVLVLTFKDVRAKRFGEAPALKPALKSEPKKVEKPVEAKVPEKKEPVKEALPKKPKPVVAVVLDDFGYTNKNFDALKEMGVPVTMAVLPNTPYAAKACRFGHENGMEVILHLPLEPKGEKQALEKDTILTGMSPDDISRIVSKNLDVVSGASGVNNHMGSKATGDPDTMRVVMGELKKRDLYFLDSMTTGDSQCKMVSSEMGVPYIARDIFIDNKKDKAYIREQLRKAENIALKNGSAIAIGHDRTVTIEALKEEAPEMRKRGVRLVALSVVLARDKE